MNMSWAGGEERKNQGGGVKMSIRLAQILHRLGFCVTHDADKKRIKISLNK